MAIRSVVAGFGFTWITEGEGNAQCIILAGEEACVGQGLLTTVNLDEIPVGTMGVINRILVPSSDRVGDELERVLAVIFPGHPFEFFLKFSDVRLVKTTPKG